CCRRRIIRISSGRSVWTIDASGTTIGSGRRPIRRRWSERLFLSTMQLKSRQEELMRATLGIAFACLVVVAGPLLAQEGHPLVGSWHGDRGSNAATRTPLTLIMDWDGSVISGLVNPGYEHAALQNAKLNPKDW